MEFVDCNNPTEAEKEEMSRQLAKTLARNLALFVGVKMALYYGIRHYAKKRYPYSR